MGDCYDSVAHIFSLTIVSFLRVRSWTLCAQWTCHVFSGPTYPISPFPVSRATGSCTCTFPFRFTCFSYLYEYGWTTRLRLLVCLVFPLLSRQLVCLRFSLMPVFFCLVDSSPCLPLLLTLTHYSLSTRLPTRYLWTLTRYQLIFLLSMFVLVSRRPLYIRLGMGTCSPSSIYFATTLKV